MVSGEVVVSSAAFSDAVESVLRRLKSAGATGLKRSVVQGQSGLGVEVFDEVLARVVADGKVQVSGEVVAMTGAAPAVSGKEEQKLRRCLPLTGRQGLLRRA